MGYAFESNAFQNVGEPASSVRHARTSCPFGLRQRPTPHLQEPGALQIAVDQADVSEAFHDHHHVSASLEFEI
jgi:hypothetical protein